MALQAARRKHQGPRQHSRKRGEMGRWRHPRNAQVTCSAPGLSAYTGVLWLFLSPHARRSLPCGHSHLHKGLWWGLIPTQRQGQTNAAASQLLAKSPSPNLDAASITLMWASTIQTWANITLTWASPQHGQRSSRCEQLSASIWASIPHCCWSLGSPAISPPPPGLSCSLAAGTQVRSPHGGRRWVWGPQQHPGAVELPLTQRRAL